MCPESELAMFLAGISFISIINHVYAVSVVGVSWSSPPPRTTSYRSGFEEKGVMNNYFGIGIDAKISLDFHNKREGNPQKCRSRTKNFMWYGVLGSKELIQVSQ